MYSSSDEETAEPSEIAWLNYNSNLPMSQYCWDFLHKVKCINGDCCPKLHEFPRDRGTLCTYAESGFCQRTAADCWFLHPGHRVQLQDPPQVGAYSVQPLGELLRQLHQRAHRTDPGASTSSSPEEEVIRPLPAPNSSVDDGEGPSTSTIHKSEVGVAAAPGDAIGGSTGSRASVAETKAVAEPGGSSSSSSSV